MSLVYNIYVDVSFPYCIIIQGRRDDWSVSLPRYEIWKPKACSLRAVGETWAAALMHCYRIQMDLCVDRKVIKQNLPHSCWFPAASISCTISLLFDACLLSSISFVSMTYIEGSYSVRRPYHQYHLIFSLSQLSTRCGGTAAVESANALLKNMMVSYILRSNLWSG